MLKISEPTRESNGCGVLGKMRLENHSPEFVLYIYIHIHIHLQNPACIYVYIYIYIFVCVYRIIYNNNIYIYIICEITQINPSCARTMTHMIFLKMCILHGPYISRTIDNCWNKNCNSSSVLLTLRLHSKTIVTLRLESGTPMLMGAEISTLNMN